LESHRQRADYQRNPSLKDNARASDSVHADLPHIAALIADGEITVGIQALESKSNRRLFDIWHIQIILW
jgi:hypothetical protein